MGPVIKITGMDLTRLLDMVAHADSQDGGYLRVAENGTGMSFAVGQGVWTYPMGSED